MTLTWLATATIAWGGPTDPSTKVSSGRVLLFDHGGMIEGQIDRLGDRFRVRQASGEVILPASPGALLLPDKAAAYAAMRQRVRDGDARQRAIFARWCLNHGFKDEALREADEALRLAPDDDTIRRFIADLRLQAQLPPPPSVAPNAAEVVPVRHETVVTTEVPPAAQTLFTSKIQPILINACAGCHARSGVTHFALTRPSMMFGDRRATQLNLAAVLHAIRTDEPMKSPLLLNALNLHGGATQPPLRDRESPAYRHLEEFVRIVTGKTASPAPTSEQSSNSAPSVPATPPSDAMSEPTALPGIKVSGPAASSPATQSGAISSEPKGPSDSKVSPAPPSSPPTPADEFDPAEFNRRYSSKMPPSDPRGERRKPDSP